MNNQPYTGPDLMPSLKNPHIAALVFYLVSYPTGFYSFAIFIAAQIIGVARRVGKPKMSMDYA